MKNIKYLELKSENEYLWSLFQDDLFIGEMTFKIENDEIYLFTIHIWDDFQKKGFGNRFIQKLFNDLNVKKILGSATKESYGFWKKCGVCFFDENKERLLPFELSRESFYKR